MATDLEARVRRLERHQAKHFDPAELEAAMQEYDRSGTLPDDKTLRELVLLFDLDAREREADERAARAARCRMGGGT